jgi:O-antigen/teichoic acid export membrane protein
MNLARVRAVGGQAALFLLAFGVAKGIAFFGPLLLSQIMAIQDYGTVELSLSIGVIGAQILSLGIPGAIPQLILIRKDGRVLDLLFFVIASIGVLGLAAAAVAYLGSDDLLYVFAGIAIAGAGAQITTSVYYRATGRRFHTLVADNLSLYLFLVVGGLVFAVLGRVPLWPVILGYGGIAIGLTAFSAIGLARTIRPQFLAAHVDARRMGFFMMVNSLAYFTIVNSSRILIGYFLSVEAVSIYSVCFRISIAIFLVHQLVGTAFFKTLYEASAEWFDRYFAILLGITMAGAAVILTVFELYGAVLLPGWAGHMDQMSGVLPITCMQVIWWVSLALLELRINRALISKQATLWLVACAGLMIVALAVLSALHLLTLASAALVFSCTLFLALQAQLFLLRRNGVPLPKTQMALFAPLVFLVPAFFLQS